MVVHIVSVVIAFLLLAAHFLRDGNTVLVAVCVLAPFLLLFKKRWCLILVRVLLFAGALVWLQTTIVLLWQRWEMDAPWMRMLLILAGVTVFTLLSAYGLGAENVRKRHP
jgi:hypothetical protein